MLDWLRRVLRPQGAETVPRAFTKKNALGVLCFALVFCLLFAGAERLLYSDTVFSSTWNRIRERGDVPQVLILGNSHAFCSFVPDILGGALGMDAAVLGASGQNSAGTTDSFEAALEKGAPRLAIVELNAFYYDYDLMRTQHKSAALGNINGMPGALRRAKAAWRELGFENIPQGMFQLLRSDLMWSRWADLLKRDGNANRYAGPDTLGYSYMNWHAAGHYDAARMQTDAVALRRDAAPIPLDARNEAELRRLLRLAGKNGVELWLVKTPTALKSGEEAGKLAYVREVARQEGSAAIVHDFHENVEDMGLAIEDFYDGGHLSRSGAAKFTEYFTGWMGERIGVTPDFTKAFAYRGERVEPEDGGSRFTMLAYGKDVRYRFVWKDGAEERLAADWSEINSVTLPLAPENADELYVSMCPAGLLEQAGTYALTLPFMVDNACVLK